MQTLTFRCPQCQRRMAVGVELIGKSVRCPHCRQVVTAPSSPSAPQSSSSGTLPFQVGTPPPSLLPASQPKPLELPQFGPTANTGAESIFGESDEPDDGLFAPNEPPPKPLFNNLPSELHKSNAGTSSHVDFDVRPKPSAQDDVAQQPTLQLSRVHSPLAGGDLNSGLESPPESLLPSTGLEGARLPGPHSNNEPTSWAALDPVGSSQIPLAVSRSSPTFHLSHDPRPFPWSMALLAYAALITLVAIWGWLRPAPHPFSMMPDFWGEFNRADRKKVSAITIPQEPLSRALRTKLGQPLIIGDLELTPQTIQHRILATHNGKPIGPVLVLAGIVKNRSAQTAFHPLDPAFNRNPVANQPEPLSGIRVGMEWFPGGPIEWPFKTERIVFVGQELDHEPLEPGRERPFVLPATNNSKLKRVLDVSREPALWQIHVRRGMVDYNGRMVSATAVIGVEFEPSQIVQN